MRSRATNILQVGVLTSGLIYITIGICYGISPIFFANIFGIEVNPDWYNLIKYDTFTAPLYHFSRIFALMLAVTGFSMILPLFDPLKFRGMIYFNGFLFPLIVVPILLKNGIVYDHMVMIICGIIFLIVFILTGVGLLITRKLTKIGIE